MYVHWCSASLTTAYERPTCRYDSTFPFGAYQRSQARTPGRSDVRWHIDKHGLSGVAPARAPQWLASHATGSGASNRFRTPKDADRFPAPYQFTQLSLSRVLSNVPRDRRISDDVQRLSLQAHQSVQAKLGVDFYCHCDDLKLCLVSTRLVWTRYLKPPNA